MKMLQHTSTPHVKKKYYWLRVDFYIDEQIFLVPCNLQTGTHN